DDFRGTAPTRHLVGFRSLALHHFSLTTPATFSTTRKHHLHSATTGLVCDQVPAGSGRLPDVGRDRDTTPSVTSEAQEKACLPVAWPFAAGPAGDLLGFGSCASLWRELRR
ncbi:hypothetical protein, partial [Micrococcus sp. F3Y]|uniref:hypothetical protein n=1 Tax=Micrococcus sp. F3Y TaxID=3402627 RepID=UPI003AF5AA05